MSSQISPTTNKAVVELLCKHLNLLLDVNVNPVQFRLAKNDDVKEGCVAVLWNILHKMCNELDSSVMSRDDDMVSLVKLHFTLLKYENLDFYCLPVDMSCGSRELVLALGWIMASQDVLEKLTRLRLLDSPLSTELGRPPSDQAQSSSSHSNSTQKDFNYVLWLAGRLRLNMREIAEMEQERIGLIAQVHKDSLKSCGLPHLSVADTKLVQDPQLLATSIDRLKADVDLIETHKQWRRKSHIFWKWMESVVVKKEESKKSMKVGAGDKQELIRFLNVLRRRVKSCVDSSMKVTASEDEPAEAFTGMPRLVLHKGKETTEVDRWLHSSERLVRTLEKQCSSREGELQAELQNIADKMKHIVVLPQKP